MKRIGIGTIVATIMGGVYLTDSLTAHAATAPKIGIDLTRTRIQSVQVFAKYPNGKWKGNCVKRDPFSAIVDSQLEGGDVVI